MGMPNFPYRFNELPDLDKDQVLLFLLATVGQEELALAHIMNAEGEKIQAAVAKFESGRLSVDELLAINDNVNDTLKTVVKKEMLLEFKVDKILEILHAMKRC
ncbi:hypothetical protein [Bacillus solimangrovi]|uniref:Uncharacterized protein n=1 Tax=Bacillus solimangrovi TaxID=1305675 RepID=A0A1E5LI63_9BACI|nr:hypothetical protein [Bacillus solimangrovi]OEH93773.1 hypothetical protein BFG57_11355 [Bacillus solimangrovi]